MTAASQLPQHYHSTSSHLATQRRSDDSPSYAKTSSRLQIMKQDPILSLTLDTKFFNAADSNRISRKMA
ncbi:hypothetical protein BDFG_07735 [Blastomyces dermatitidis ATCC 26199]|nr:hypothetical protein BDFG_07735 [Blastomyces dermatitidis ATCC 26199]